MTADAIAFMLDRPIGKTKSGEDIFASLEFLQQLLAIRDRTGGAAANFIADALAAAANAQITADGKITSVWQDDPPDVADFDEGDLWFDTNDGNKAYQLRSGAWVNAQDSAIATAISAASDAQSTADGKVTTFFQTSAPTAEGVGDLWHDSDDAQRRTYRWSGSAWVHITDQTAYNVAAAIAGQGALATMSQVAAAVLAAGVGKNCIIDGDFRLISANWLASTTSGSVSAVAQVGAGVRYLYVAGTGVTIGQSISAGSFRQRDFFPVQAGERIEASVYFGRDNTTGVALYLQWRDASGSLLGDTLLASSAAGVGGGGALSTYLRIGGFATAPVGAERATLAVFATASSSSPRLLMAKPYIGRAGAAQTELTPWNIGFEAVPGADVTAENTASSVAGQGPLTTITPPSYAGNAAAFTALGAGQLYRDSTDGNAVKTTVAPNAGFAVSLSALSDSALATPTPTNLVSISVTASATGAVGSVTYRWQQLNTGVVAGSANSPNSATTTFNATPNNNSTDVALFQVTAVDTGTGQVATAVFQFEVTHSP